MLSPLGKPPLGAEIVTGLTASLASISVLNEAIVLKLNVWLLVTFVNVGAALLREVNVKSFAPTLPAVSTATIVMLITVSPATLGAVPEICPVLELILAPTILPLP